MGKKNKIPYIMTPEEERLKDVPLSKKELIESCIEGLMISGYTYKDAQQMVINNYYKYQKAKG